MIPNKIVMFVFHPRGVSNNFFTPGCAEDIVIELACKKRIMSSAKIVKKQQKDTVSEEIPITVHARNQQWTVHCGIHEPLANTMFKTLDKILGGKCMMYYPTVTRNLQLLDPTKTPAFYGMIYDDIVYLRAVIRPSERVGSRKLDNRSDHTNNRSYIASTGVIELR